MNDDYVLDPANADKIFRVEEDALEQYLKDMRLDNLFSELVEELLVKAPNNPVSFMIDHLFTHYPDQAQGSSFAKTFPNAMNAVGGGVPLTGISEQSRFIKEERGSEEEDDDDVPRDEQDDPFSKQEYFEHKGERRLAISTKHLADLDKIDENNYGNWDLGSEDYEFIMDRIRRHSFFSSLQEYQLSTIAKAFKVSKHKLDALVYMKGDHDEKADCFYLVNNGFIGHYIEKDCVMKSRTGDSFGEIALLYDCPRKETAKVLSDRARLLKLSRDDYKGALIQAVRANRNEVMEHLRDVHLFKTTLTKIEFMRLAEDVAKWRNYKTGEVLVKQHSPAETFFIIDSGSVRVEQKLSPSEPNELVTVLKAPQYFGEIALIADRPRAASVVAETNVRCICISRDEFSRVLGPMTEILKRDESLFTNFVTDKI